MCGGYSITTDLKKVGEYFKAEPPASSFKPLARAAPSQVLPVILDTSPDKISLIRWGFQPAWKKSGQIINARKEGLTEKPTFKKPFAEQRCLILTDGFLEWQKTSGKSVPHRISLESQLPFALAGIWRFEKSDKAPDNNPEPRFVIITVKPNTTVAKIHDRMPALLLPEQKNAWLGAEATPNYLLNLLQPFPSKETILNRLAPKELALE